MDLYDPYFFTQTIHGFVNLLTQDSIKMLIINSLQFLVQQKYIEIYGYVIMPNHIHLLLRVLKSETKESPMASFAKFSAHQFKKYLQINDSDLLDRFKSDKNDRSHQFWKRDPLAIPITSEEILFQKLEYIHNNPLGKKWNNCMHPEDYRWSSARFYLTGIDEFGIVKHYKE
jgi:putative transposase